MKDSDLDTETIAALLAGKLGELERAAALEKLASSGDDFRLFLETAAVLRQIEEEEQGAPGRAGVECADGDAGVIKAQPLSSPPAVPPQGTEVSAPPSVTRPRWRRRSGAVAIASVVAIALSVLIVSILPRRPAPHDPPSAPAALLARPGLPREMIERRPWSQAMGSQATLSRPALAARLGALHTDFAVALRARDTSGVSAVMTQIRLLLAQLLVGDEVAKRYGAAEEAARDEPERSTLLLQRAWEMAASLLERERDWMEAGAWAEAGRIAVVGRDAAFFAAPATRAGLQRARGLPLSDRGKDALARARTEIRAGGEPRWSVLGPALDELLSALGD